MTALPEPFLGTLATLRDFGMCRLVVLDIDGTLLADYSSSIGENIRLLERSLRLHSFVTVTLATGRAWTGARRIAGDLHGQHTLVICYNGAVVFRAGSVQPILHETLNTTTVDQVLCIAEEAATALVYYFGGRSPVFTGGIEEVVGYSVDGTGQRTEFNQIHIEWHPWSSRSSDAALPATAIVLFPRGTVESLYERLQMVDGIAPTVSGSGFIDIRRAGVTKATALARIATLLGVDRRYVIAAGDNDNDVEMLEWAGIGVAVANASPSAMHAAKYFTSRPGGDGVAELLSLVRTAHRYGQGPM